MGLTRSEVAVILQRLSEERKRYTKRKVDFQSVKMYNEGKMSRVELLAKALGGVVIEDLGYRGIIYVEDKKEYVRYHSAHGVHIVQRTPKVWRTVRAVLSSDEVRPFLEECGLVPKIQPVEKPLESLAKACDGEVVTTFQTGGGVLRSAAGVYYRFSNITGLDIVEHVVTKWRTVKHVASRTDTMVALLEDKAHTLFPQEVLSHGNGH
jgi:hypothetical protein